MPAKKSQLAEVENKMSEPGFWDNQDAAQSTIAQLSALKAVIEPVEELSTEVEDLAELLELAAERGRRADARGP